MNISKKQTYSILFVLTVLAFLLRIYLLPTHLFFGPEQGRDFLVIRDIVNNHKLTLIGSKTDVDGIFHGPIFYYLSSVPFALSHGNPITVSVFLVVLYSITVYGIYLVTFEITKNVRTSLFASLCYVISFGLIVNARWLSNPPLSIPLSVLYMLFTVRFLQKKYLNIIGVAISYALLGQVEFINFALFGVISLMILIRYRAIVRFIPKRLAVLAGILSIVLSIGNYAYFDLRHDFLITNSVMRLLNSGSLSKPLVLSFTDAFRMLFSQIAYMTGSLSWEIGALIGICIMYCFSRLRKQNGMYDLIIIWIVTPAIVLALLRYGVLDQLYVGSFNGYIIALSIAIAFARRKNKLLGYALLSYILIQNVFAYSSFLPKNQHIFFQSPQPDVRYGDQLLVINGIYARAKGRSFQIQSYTIPYFWQDGWIYLFWYVGSRKYGYVPDKGRSDVLYVIIQKDGSNPNFQNTWYTKTVSTWGRKTDVFQIGEFTVEELLTTQT